MDPPTWGVYDQFSRFIKLEHAYFKLSNLLPFDIAAKHLENICSASTTRESRPSQLFGQSHSFEKVEEILQQLKIKKKILMLELKITTSNPDEVTKLFDIFTTSWNGYFRPFLPPIPPNDSASELIYTPPSLKLLAGLKILERIGAQKEIRALPIPTNLQWFLQGIQMRNTPDSTWKERLDCDRRAAFRDFTIKAEVAGVLPKGSGDEAGKKILNESLLSFYDAEEQRTWRTSYVVFRPFPTNSMFGYDMKVPLNHSTSSSALASEIEKAINAKPHSETDTNHRWAFSSGSSGGTFTNHTANRFNITNDRKLNWQTVFEARAGFTKFAEIVKTQPWENDKVVVTLQMRGGSCAELDLCASEITRLISECLPFEKSDILAKCWFSTFFEDSQSPSIPTLKECMSQLAECQLVTNTVIQITKMDEHEKEKLTNQLSEIPVTQPEQKAVNSSPKKNFLQRMFSKDKPPATDQGEGEKLWDTMAEGKYYGSLVFKRFQTISGEGNDTELSLGCAMCVGMLAHRSDGYGYGPVMCSMCSLHRSVYLLHHAKDTLGFKLGPRSLQAATGTVYISDYSPDMPPKNAMVFGLASPEILKGCLDGLECGKLTSCMWTWNEKNVHQLMQG